VPPASPILVVENDPFTRIVEVVLDPRASAERRAAYADFFAHDEPDFSGWCEHVRARAPGLYPAEVRLVDTPEQLRRELTDAHAAIIESLPVGRADIEAAPRLSVIQKFGIGLRDVDTAACSEMGIKVLTIRRRANVACAETAVGLMLVLAKKMHRLAGRISADRLAEIGFPYRPFDRRHTPNSNWARIPGIRMLRGTTAGIIGLGEIGREIALILAAFGVRLVYHQRTRLSEAEERELHVRYMMLDQLLSVSDWVIPQLPSGPATRHLIDRARIGQMKPGAILVNVSRPDVVERAAIVDALKSGHLGGFALDPQYEAPGRSDDEFLGFDNVVLTPHIAAQPRFNALSDLEDLIAGLAQEMAE
jgi:phosphoglycerate dehydrogenase-like enzyme